MAIRQNRLLITKRDYDKLSRLLNSEYTQAIGNKPYLTGLRSDLAMAEIVDSEAVNPDVVTMNSKVILVDLDTDEDEIYVLVYPDQANIANGRLSILTPIGTAILGCRVGDLVNGIASRIQIKEILYQPERQKIAFR
ncbi:GreA/GreB family elongation factor [Gimesia sp.]|uniref:GreA/GreB family elongation factor n=1 Tax=Gimesia sp. TaxID=2024833 RepID=UPI003A8D865C